MRRFMSVTTTTLSTVLTDHCPWHQLQYSAILVEGCTGPSAYSLRTGAL